MCVNSSTCTNTKRSTSNLNIPNEEQAERKPTPTDMPAETLPQREGNTEAPSVSAEPQEKEKAKKTKNNKGAKPEAPQVNAVRKVHP